MKKTSSCLGCIGVLFFLVVAFILLAVITSPSGTDTARHSTDRDTDIDTAGVEPRTDTQDTNVEDEQPQAEPPAEVPPPDEPAAPMAEVSEGMLIEYAKAAIENQLLSPSTAEFPGTILERDQWQVALIRDTKELYAVTSHVDSQNGYGAMIRNPFQVFIRFTPDVSVGTYEVLFGQIGGDVFGDVSLVNQLLSEAEQGRLTRELREQKLATLSRFREQLSNHEWATWQNKAGDHEVEAKFVEFDDETKTIILERRNGKRATVAIDKLSTKSRKHAGEIMRLKDKIKFLDESSDE